MEAIATPVAPPGRRYLALWFRWLPCERAWPDTAPAAARPEGDAAEAGVPRALVERRGNALRLAAVSAAAQHAGLAPGMTLADARARCPALETLPHDAGADARLLARLASQLQAFTPMVALDPPDGLILDISGCAHLFGGEAALTRQAVAATGLTARAARAAHAAAARALARHGGEGASDVHGLPVSALDLPEDALAGLRRAGLRRIGDLAQRPMAGLAARFGAETVQRLRAILGELPGPIAARAATAPIAATLRFAEPLARSDDVLDCIEELLAQVIGQLAARGLGGRRFVVRLERSDGAVRRLAVETGQPVRDSAVVLRLLRERIDSLADPLDPGFGYDALSLHVPVAQPLPARQLGLEAGGDAADADIGALIDRLATRLGRDNVRRLRARDTHIPEAAQQFVAAASVLPGWPAASGALRPLLLLDPPAPITTITSVPDGPPARFGWRGAVHDVRHAEGPERIAAEWWRHPGGHLPGSMALTRDYYRVEDMAGRRFWLFRHGLYTEKPEPRWYIHGLFA